MGEKPPLKIEERITECENAKQCPQSSRPKIQRVASYLRNLEHFAKHYSPKMVSMGPIHHGDPNLKQGEEYKRMWAFEYIKNNTQISLVLYNKIANKFEELKGLFTSDLLTDEKFPNYSSERFAKLEEKLCWMLFVDGCALLHILENAKLDKPKQMNLKVDQLVLVMQDVLLLENQLPYLLLNLLWKDNDESKLIDTMKEFLKCHHWATPNSESSGQKQHDIEGGVPRVEAPTHLLDLQRRIILPPEMRCNGAASNDMVTYRNIQELKAAGIKLKSSKTRRPRDISFKCGWFDATLTLPEIVVDDTTAVTFINLIAYEICPDFDNDYGICSFAAFMDSLIDHPDDVKALRSEKILFNSLGSDEDVAALFNIISTKLVPNMSTYSHVRDEINKHYTNQLKTWIAEAIHTHFSSPWTFTAFVAAFLALVLTFVQTWFAIFPKS